MGDWYQTIVDPLVSEAEATAIADAVLAGLVEAGLVESAVTDCTLGKPGHAPASGVSSYMKDADDMLFSLKTNGLEVITGRRPFVSTNVECITCPHCDAVSTDLARLSWQDAIGEWYEGGTGDILCPSCKTASSVATWHHEPPCAFGNLAFTFWNWPPFEPRHWHKTPAAFIETIIGHPCVLVKDRV